MSTSGQYRALSGSNQISWPWGNRAGPERKPHSPQSWPRGDAGTWRCFGPQVWLRQGWICALLSSVSSGCPGLRQGSWVTEFPQCHHPQHCSPAASPFMALLHQIICLTRSTSHPFDLHIAFLATTPSRGTETKAMPLMRYFSTQPRAQVCCCCST